MNTNILEDVQGKRIRMKEFAKKALDFKWIDQDTYNSIIKKLDEDLLTIGVIGQMKAGKSTFLNAFLFQDEILPAATTPMTAALSVITYGDSKRIVAEFYNKNEWDEMLLEASHNPDEKDESLCDIYSESNKSKIKAAKELVDKASRLGSKLNSLLGQTKNDEFDNLIEYVGADGRFVSITKSVTIYYPAEWLKGVEIVDTPGFNDPVVSREERTQDFLKKADVVILLLYAGRAFDSTDKAILFDKVQNVGIGKVLIGVNKYDLCYSQGETIQEITTNVSNEIQKACRETKDSLINELLADLVPIPFSANMALMARMPLNEVISNTDIKFHWDQACNIFEISSQKQLLEKSLIVDLENAVKSMIEKSKQEILFRKPLNMIIQSGINSSQKIELSYNDKKREVENLSLPDSALDENIENLNKVQRRIQKNSQRVVEDMKSSFNDTIKQAIKTLEDITDSAKKDMHNIIDTEKSSNVENRLRNRITKFQDRDLKRAQEKIEGNLREVLVEKENQFCDDIEEVLHKYLPDSEDLIEDAKRIIKNESDNISFSKYTGEISDEKEEDSDDFNFFENFLAPFIGGLLIFPMVFYWIDQFNDHKNELRSQINDYFDKINFDDFSDKTQPIKQKFVDLLQTKAVNEIFDKLRQQLESIKENKANKEKQLAEAKQQLSKFADEKQILTNQIQEMDKMKIEII